MIKAGKVQQGCCIQERRDKDVIGLVVIERSRKHKSVGQSSAAAEAEA